MRSRISISLFGILLMLLSFSFPILAQQVRTESKRRIVTRVSPVYPPIARNNRLSGTVRLYAIVAPAGKVVRTELVGGNPLLAQSATIAVSKFTWERQPDETKELVEVNFQFGAE